MRSVIWFWNQLLWCLHPRRRSSKILPGPTAFILIKFSRRLGKIDWTESMEHAITNINYLQRLFRILSKFGCTNIYNRLFTKRNPQYIHLCIQVLCKLESNFYFKFPSPPQPSRIPGRRDTVILVGQFNELYNFFRWTK